MTWMSKLAANVNHIVPRPILNNVLLTFPFLYRTRVINYETMLDDGIKDLMTRLATVANLDGNIIECGSPYAATSIIMAIYLRSRGLNKLIYACDSFEGFNRSELEKERKAGLTSVSDKAFTFTSYSYVKRKIKRLGFEGVIVPVRGYFEQTLPGIKDKYCFALIDCDLQESIVYCLERLFPDVVSGGCMMVDDYASDEYKGARLGVDFFVNKHRDEISGYGMLNKLYYVTKK
jgi:hypothetical protein